MTNKRLYVVLLGLAVMFFACGLIYGMVSVDVTNHFETGIVDIDLTEYQIVDGKETLWEDDPIILPGDLISKIPRIHNSGNDCYVRAKITFRETDELNDSHLVGISDKWVKAEDGYYYYTEILPHGEDVDIFEALSIPVDFSQDNQGKKFYIDIDADAIQSLNFTPNFDSATPWGEIQILECEKEGEYDVSTFKPSDNQVFQILYQGDAKDLIKNHDDFFINFPYMMPGDTFSDSVNLENDSNSIIKLHFRSVATNNSELLDKIQLKITTEIDGEEVTFYEGSLRAAELAEDTVLGELEANAKGTFNFEIYVPHELNNEFSISSSAVQWVFSTEVTEVPDNPETGDNTNIVGYFTFMVISGVALILLIAVPFLKKKEACKHDN